MAFFFFPILWKQLQLRLHLIQVQFVNFLPGPREMDEIQQLKTMVITCYRRADMERKCGSPQFNLPYSRRDISFYGNHFPRPIGLNLKLNGTEFLNSVIKTSCPLIFDQWLCFPELNCRDMWFIDNFPYRLCRNR